MKRCFDFYDRYREIAGDINEFCCFRLKISARGSLLLKTMSNSDRTSAKPSYQSHLLYLPCLIFNKPRVHVRYVTRRYIFSRAHLLWVDLITARGRLFRVPNLAHETFSGLSTNHRRFIRLPSCLEITIVAIVAGHHLQSMPRKQYGVYSRRMPYSRASFYSRDTRADGIRLIRIHVVIKYFSRDGYRSDCVWYKHKRSFQLRLIINFSLSEK